jgi:Uma2 family endonuclease
MASTIVTSRPFVAGTSGWTADDLDDPAIEAKWLAGRFEIVEGVLTKMPAAYFDSGIVLMRLIRRVHSAIIASDPDGEIVCEVDVVVGQLRVPRVDALYLSPQDRKAQERAHAAKARKSPVARNLKYGRVVVPPSLIIESLSQGHEAHDRVTKRAWYAQMRVPHYWMLHAFDHTLECLRLAGADYTVDAAGKEDAVLRPSAFPGLELPLSALWVK